MCFLSLQNIKETLRLSAITAPVCLVPSSHTLIEFYRWGLIIYPAFPPGGTTEVLPAVARLSQQHCKKKYMINQL